MATDIQISQLNEVTCNNDLNHIIINDRESAGDDGITKKIQLCNFLTPNLVKETNIIDSAVTRDKIAPLSVDCSRIVNNTITCNQIAQYGIANYNFDSNSVDNRALNNCCGFTVKCLTVNDGPVNISHPINGCLAVESGVTKLNNITYNWPTAQTANKFLKTNGDGGLSWEEAVPGESTSLVFSEIMPVGTVVPWAGVGNVPDDKWLECSGATFEGTLYPELCAALGDTWGDPVNGFYYLPDLRGRVAIGAGTSTDINNDTYIFNVADMDGEYNHTLCIAEMPAHQHALFGNDRGTSSSQLLAPGLWRDDAETNRTTDPGTIQPTGGGQSHNNIQPYTVTRYIIKAKPDDIQQFDMNVGPGLSALNASGGQTANIDLSSSEIGLKVSDDFEFDGSGKLTLNDSVSASSVTFDDGTVLTTGEQTAFYGVMVSNNSSRTTPAQMRDDRANANFFGAWDEYSKGWINTGSNNSGYSYTNSLMYTMHVNVLSNNTITMYNFNTDDYFYIYVDDVLQYTGSNYSSGTPRVVTFALTTGQRRIDIIKNDSGGGSNSFELMGNIIGTNVQFISGY